jgi:small-conductance mechanosensitive channel
MNRAGNPITPTFTAARMLALILLWLCSQPVWAQADSPEDAKAAPSASAAPVIVDGNQLFTVRGITSYPAPARAALIRSYIIAAAEDETIPVEDIHAVESADRTQIYAGKMLLLAVFDLDAENEDVDRKLLAAAFTAKIATAISQYRTDRSRPVLLRHSAFALAATVLMALILWSTVRVTRWVKGWAELRIQKKLETLEDKAHRLIRAEQAWAVFAGLLRALRFVLIALLAYFYLNTVLGLYPWTRPAAMVLFDVVLNPLETLWSGFVASVPDLVFLAILFVVVRYLLRLVRLFFEGVQMGRIRLQNFDPDWALPSFKILRFLIVAFAVVVAYPYIPGSDSMAFKGVSLFLGVIFSLGSSSFIANMMAGLSMTYRGAFKDGDRVNIGDVTGAVEGIKLMTTRIRTPKNEIVVIPNSNILSTNVVNYSALARTEGLILHSVVGIGYDAPWRQVEAMLLLAVARTEGLQQEPKPFVLQLSLGDFAVNYEVNAYCNDASRRLALYSALHANIQDVFNEHGVQIMSPAYESDPDSPKVVPPDQWYAAPAAKPVK